MGRYSYDGWSPYVPVAERRRRAARLVAKMRKSGREVFPVEIAGRKIAATFWGDAWCSNLEAYSDYANRLPRGRTYVRNGSVIDLQIEKGHIRSLVSGSEIYEVDISIKPLAKKRWTAIKSECGGNIDSLVELLQGSISKGVMEIVTRKGEGLFPSPREISLSCSCLDWASLCKHVAATLYGVGARLDHEPELLFTLRGVDPEEMVVAAVKQPPTVRKSRRSRVLETDELSSVFGVDIDMDDLPSDDVPMPVGKRRSTAQKQEKASSRAKSRSKARPAAKKPSAAEATSTKPAGKKAGSKKTTAEKATSKKTTAKKAASPKPTRKKAATRKTASKKKTSTAKPTAKKRATSKKVSQRKTKTPARRRSG